MNQLLVEYWHDDLNNRVRFRIHGSISRDWDFIFYHKSSDDDNTEAVALLQHLTIRTLAGCRIARCLDTGIKGDTVCRCLRVPYTKAKDK